MASPQENRYTQIANDLLAALMRIQLAPNQWQVLLFIIRKTNGYHKKVDYIANSQIVYGTGLRKDVVSRALYGLKEKELIYRNGKAVSVNENWEQWKLAEPQTKKLAELSTELAELSTKVGSLHVTQKKKETVQNKKKLLAETFEEYREKLKGRFSDVNFNLEIEKFNLYWNEGGRQQKNPKLALLNWLTKAREMKNARGNSNGVHRGNPRRVPRSEEYKQPDQYD